MKTKNSTKIGKQEKQKSYENKTGFLIKLCVIGVIAAVVILGGCIGSEKEPPGGGDIVGGDKDEYGCIGSAGYAWNDTVGACIREWELDENQKKAAKIAVEPLSFYVTVIRVDVARCPGCFAVNLQRNDNREQFIVVIDNWTVKSEIVGGDKDEHGCIGSAGYTWCEAKQKCLRIWEENCSGEDMNEELCSSAGGHWNNCSNKCQIDNQGIEGAACTMQCEALCECGGIAGFGCPKGYICKMPGGIADALGYCIPLEEKPPATGEGKHDCESDSDCIPLPSECHPTECINKKFEYEYTKPDVCTEIFMLEAAYKPEDCVCVKGKCMNINLGRRSIEGDNLTPTECLYKGGRAVNTVGGETCSENETNIGDVEGFISPAVCCLVIDSFDACVNAGNPAMESYPRQCRTPGGKTFTEEHCTKTGTTYTMTLETAKNIALSSECGNNLKNTYVCNEYTGTYWIDLDMEKEGCNPACVVNIETEKAEINWRCTGALPPENKS